MEMNKIGIFLVAFLTLIIGINLLTASSESLVTTTTLSDSVNETLTFANGTMTDGRNQTNVAQAGVGVGLKSVSYFANITGGDLTSKIGTNVNWTSAGVVTINRADQTIGANNTYYITYKYGLSSYTDDANSRTIIKLIGLFFAVAVFGIGIWYLWKNGLQDMV